VVNELEEFFGLALAFSRLWTASLTGRASKTERAASEAKRSALFGELRAREPAIQMILAVVGLEPFPIEDDSSAIDLGEALMLQFGLVLDAYKALDKGRPELIGFLGLLEASRERALGADVADATGQALAELHRKEEPVKDILGHLGPELADFDIDQPDGRRAARDAVTTGLDIIDGLNHLDWQMASRMSEGPVMAADQLHPWVWDAVRGLCEAGHYRQAVQAAATAISARTQVKLGRQDITDVKLMQEAFSPSAPVPGSPRLRCPGDEADQTVQSRQRGALQYAVGCFSAIRNPATHEHREWDPQVAIECLAALSVVARWIDDWALATGP
jgi:uncharacterized protein (TIGR02391 family)